MGVANTCTAWSWAHDRAALLYRLSVLQGSSAVRGLSTEHAPCCLQCTAGLQARQVWVWCCCCHRQPDGQQVSAGACPGVPFLCIQKHRSAQIKICTKRCRRAKLCCCVGQMCLWKQLPAHVQICTRGAGRSGFSLRVQERCVLICGMFCPAALLCCALCCLVCCGQGAQVLSADGGQPVHAV